MTEKMEFFGPIQEKSLFNFLSQAKGLEILELLGLEEFEDKQNVDIERENNLVIVAKGVVELVDPLTDKLIGRVTDGRSIELKNFLNPSLGYKYKLRSSGNTAVFVLERKVFDKYFSDLNLREYLDRVTRYPELRKLKNDLTLLGYEQDQISKLVSHLKMGESEQLIPDSFCVVHKGRVLFKIKEGFEEVEITNLTTGDSFKSVGDDELIVEVKSLSYWYISGEMAKQLNLYRTYQQLCQIFDPISKEVTSYKQVRETVGERKIITIEGDDFTVEDFQVEKLPKIKKRKPVHVKQHDEMDCGAACMSTMAKYYGKNVSVAAYRSLIHITREGASMFSLKQAANKTGFDAIVIFSGFKALQGMILPAIALMQYHFVVVFEITDKYVLLSDPGIGMRKMPIEEFKAQWSGNTMCLKTNQDFKKVKESASSWSKYLKLIKGQLFSLFDIFSSSLLLFLFSLATPLFLQFIFDNVLTSQDMKLMHGLAVIMIVFSLLKNYLGWCRTYLTAKLSSKLELKFSTLFISHVLKLPIGYFAVRNVGDITSRIGEMDSIREFITGKSLSTFMNILSLFIYLTVLFLYSPSLALFVVVMVPIVLVVIKIFGDMIKMRYNQLFGKAAKAQSLLYEQLDGLLTIKSLNVSLFSQWRWREKFEETLMERQGLETILAIFGGIKEFFNELFRVLLLGLAIYLYMKEELSLGQVVAVNSLSGQIITPYIALFSLWDEYKQIQVSFDKVDDIFTAAPDREEDSKEVVDLENLDIRFEDVSFQYGSELSPVVLDQVSLEIKQGETVAFVGESGCGKSTLAYMVGSLYQPRSGKVFLGGVDLQEFPIQQLRNKVKVVLQDNNLFSGTVIENIALGEQSTSFGDIVKAAQSADAHEFIAKLPHGYNTKLGEKGEGALSGGQKQRINIARAFYADPDILILDEATSSLDAISEEKIIENVKNRKGKTTIIIAHRLNTIAYADKIVVMDQGRILEMGSHQELIKRRGRYYHLFKKQLNI